MNDLKENVRKLIIERRIENRKVVLFSVRGIMYEVAKVLVSNGITPYVLSYVSRCDDLHGIFPYISVKELKQASNILVLLTRDEFRNNRLFFEKIGLHINENILIDCKLQGANFYRNLAFDKVKTWVAAQKKHIYIIKKLAISYGYYCLGKSIANKLQKSMNTQLYLYDYTGMGDVFVLCLFLKKKEEMLKDTDCVLVVRNSVCERVARMSRIENVECVTPRQMKWLIYYARIPNWNNDNIHAITPFPNRIYTDIYSHYLYGKRINMADAYRCVMFDIQDKTVVYPLLKGNSERINSFFDSTEIDRGNTVIISPYANTVIGYPMKFWEEIANALLQEGFSVFTNVVGSEKEIPGTKRATFIIEDAEAIVNQAGYFLALRSGLCDVISNSTAYKCFIYPYYYIFNSSVYDFCSFKKMRIGTNYSEIRWGYDELELLKKIILKKFTNARIARTLMLNSEK